MWHRRAAQRGRLAAAAAAGEGKKITPIRWSVWKKISLTTHFPWRAGFAVRGSVVADVLAAVGQYSASRRRSCLSDVATRRSSSVLAAAVEPRITHVVLDGLLPSFASIFNAQPTPINARASCRTC